MGDWECATDLKLAAFLQRIAGPNSVEASLPNQALACPHLVVQVYAGAKLIDHSAKQ